VSTSSAASSSSVVGDVMPGPGEVPGGPGGVSGLGVSLAGEVFRPGVDAASVERRAPNTRTSMSSAHEDFIVSYRRNVYTPSRCQYTHNIHIIIIVNSHS